MQIDYHLFFDKSGKPISRDEWADLTTTEYKTIKREEVGNLSVSTIWLGMNFALFGPPLIFETMVFADGHEIVYQDRYTTMEDALTGHKEALKWAKLASKHYESKT